MIYNILVLLKVIHVNNEYITDNSLFITTNGASKWLVMIVITSLTKIVAVFDMLHESSNLSSIHAVQYLESLCAWRTLIIHTRLLMTVITTLGKNG